VLLLAFSSLIRASDLQFFPEKSVEIFVKKLVFYLEKIINQTGFSLFFFFNLENNICQEDAVCEKNTF
jgi:hypothetical protein